MQYMRTTEKVDFEEFKDKFQEFKTIPKHLPLKTIEVPSYGVMVMLGFLAAILLGYARAKQYGIDPNIIIDLGIVVMIAAIVGARLWHVIEFWSSHIHTEGTTFWQAMKKAVMIQQGGLVFYGGMLLALLSAAIYLRIKKQSVFLYFDFLAVILPLGHAFGRTGCFLNGCCFGKTCDAHHFLAVAFPGGSPASALTQPVYATQGLAVVTNIIIFILLTIYYETLAKKRVETFFMYCLLYGISRFISHLLRGDVPEMVFGLTSSQFLSALLFVIGLAGVIFFRFFREKDKPPHLEGIGNTS
ncbi:MAG: prolipoprotein diacylglyceryl transferase, partial [Candidatus Heimdallarchaeota archaeon]|nr:prolipoprotein diacylglyceryl transferase [Candidatus Heimdallarchaeota archaeon]